MSKPAAVTLPIVLILIDFYWSDKFRIKYIFNKIPFLILSVFFAILPFIGQTNKTTVDITPLFTIVDRFFLLNYAVFFYILKLVFPWNLSTLHYYPIHHDTGLPPEYYLAPLINLLIIASIFIAGKNKKTLLFGLLFFIITIGPSLQIVPYGQAIVAERYTYIPYIGLLFIFGKFFSDIYENKIKDAKKLKPIVNTILVIALVFFSIQTYSRNKVWKDGIVLFTDVIDKNPDIFYSYNARGDAKSDNKDYAGALEDYLASIKLQSNWADAHFNAGRMYYYLNKYKESIDEYNKALLIKHNYPEAFCNRAAVYFLLNDFKATIDDCNHAIELKPDYADAYINRGNAKGVLKDYTGSIEDFDKGISLNPNLVEAYMNRGISKELIGQKDSGCSDFNMALNLGDKNAEVLINKYCK